MSDTNKPLMLKFRDHDTRFGVTRETLQTMANDLGVNETQVVHMALAKLAGEVLPAYEADDGPLTARQLATVQKLARFTQPQGRALKKEVLF